MNYQCYGCQQTFNYVDLAAECMCLHVENPKYRGVCKPCAKDNVPLKIEDPENHHLTKIHQYSEESNKFWKDVEEKCPDWSGFTFNTNKNIEISHPNFPTGIKSWKEMKEKLGEEAVNDLAYSEQRSKKTEFPISYDQFREMSKCTCCH